MKEFKINDLLALKLENNKTVIYVNNQRYDECKYLLLNVANDNHAEFDDIQSIDEAEEVLDHSLEERAPEDDIDPDTLVKITIPPEVEFWGHCSNLQAWAEHGYDTRLLHRNLSFHLLKALADAGDLLARQKLKEEIVERYNSGNVTVREYLWFEKFLLMLDENELRHLQINAEEIDALVQLKIPMEISPSKVSQVHYEIDLDVARGTIKELLLPDRDWNEVPAPLQKFKNLEKLSLYNNYLTTLPDWIWKFKSLKRLNLGKNKLSEIPDTITGENSLQYLDLSENSIKTLPNSIENLTTLEEISIYKGRLESLPESFGNLKSLKRLTINETNLSELPESFGNLPSLEELNLFNNKIKKLPDSIGNLKSIHTIFLGHNELESLPDSIGNLKTLKVLNVSFNQLMSVPESIANLSGLYHLSLIHNKLFSIPKDFENLTSLKNLDLRSNYLETLPENIQKCTSLESLWLSHNPICEFPRWIFNLKRFSYLDIEDTNISTIYIEKEKEKCNRRQIRLIY